MQLKFLYYSTLRNWTIANLDRCFKSQLFSHHFHKSLLIFLRSFVNTQQDSKCFRSEPCSSPPTNFSMKYPLTYSTFREIQRIHAGEWGESFPKNRTIPLRSDSAVPWCRCQFCTICPVLDAFTCRTLLQFTHGAPARCQPVPVMAWLHR